MCAVVSVFIFVVFTTPLRQVFDRLLAKVTLQKHIQNANESAKTDFVFFDSLRTHRWANAHRLLTADCQKSVSEGALRQKWMAIETRYGKNEVWQRNNKSMGIVSDYLENDYLLRETNGMAKASLRLVRQEGMWRIDKLTLTP